MQVLLTFIFLLNIIKLKFISIITKYVVFPYIQITSVGFLKVTLQAAKESDPSHEM